VLVRCKSCRGIDATCGASERSITSTNRVTATLADYALLHRFQLNKVATGFLIFGLL
jgi:hypothetical protein